MLNFPIIDTHVHLWDPNRLQYDWLHGSTTLNRTFAPQDYREATATLPVEKTVFVECGSNPGQTFAEVDWVLECAEQEPRLSGVVASVELEKGARIEPDLARLAQIPLVRGVRRLLQGEADAEFCLQPDFVQGVRLLARYGLHFEICILHPQMAGIIQLVQKCPEVRFILDHIGKPDIKNHLLLPWQTQIGELASLPNVWCKVSGMVTEADHQNWTIDDLRPYAETVFSVFGMDRVLYGSDWPVSTLASTYTRWAETLDTLTADYSETERRKLFYENAHSFYRL